MPMSNVPMLAWSNRRIPILMFKVGFQPVICNALTSKMRKNATHARMESVLSLSLHCVSEYDRLETGLYTTALPDLYCWSVRCKLSVTAVKSWIRLVPNNEVSHIVTTCKQLCFFKGFASVHVREFSWTASVHGSQDFLQILRMHSPSTHLLRTLVKCETADSAHFSCLDVMRFVWPPTQ